MARYGWSDTRPVGRRPEGGGLSRRPLGSTSCVRPFRLLAPRLIRASLSFLFFPFARAASAHLMTLQEYLERLGRSEERMKILIAKVRTARFPGRAASRAKRTASVWMLS